MPIDLDGGDPAAGDGGETAELAAASPVRAASLQELVLAAAHQTAAGPAAFLGPLGEVLLLDALAAAAEGPLRGMATTAGLRRALGRALQGAAGVDMKPSTLAALARRLGKGEHASARGEAKVTEVARLYRLYREHLGPRRLDAALLWQRGLLGLAESPQLAGVDVVELHGLHRAAPWDAVPTPHALMETIDALSKSGRQVRVLLPEVEERPLLALALAPLYDALFRKHELDVDVVPVPLGPAVAGDTAWARFLRGLFQKTGTPPLVAADELAADQLSCSPLPSPRAEAQKVARRVRDLVDGGTAPGAIAVVAQSPERRAGLVEALTRYGVPVYVPPVTGLHGESRLTVLPPPLQALLGLFDTLLQGLPREGLIQAMTSGYFRFPGPLQKRPWQVARALRAAGVRDLRPAGGSLMAEDEPWLPGTQGALGAPRRPSPGAPADYRQRLEQWLRQQATPQRPSGTAGRDAASAPAPATDAPLPEALLAVARQVDAVVGELTSLPETATLSEHCAAVRRLTERLQLTEHALLLGPDAVPLAAAELADPGAPADEDDGVDAAAILAEQCLALARDQAALGALRQVLDDLPRLARRLRLQTEPVARTRFAALLRAALLRLLPAAGPVGTPGAGVLVAELGQLGDGQWAQLFVTGLVDGELPQRIPEDAVLDDDDRRALNRLCDAPVWPLAQHEGERTPLLLAEALAHSQAAHLSWPTADEEGRPLLRSPLVEAVLHAAARGEPGRLRVPLLPWPDEARHRTELWARAVLQRSLADEPKTPSSVAVPSEPPAARYGADAPLVRLCTPTLLVALAAHDRRRAARLRDRIAVEQLRSRWFSNLAAAAAPPVLEALAGPFVGRLSPGQEVERLQPRLPGSAKHPLSASALEDYAKCPFRFFVRRVLKAAPLTESGEDLDPLASGRLHHAVLESFFKNRRQESRLPLHGDNEDHAAMDAAVDDELRKFHQSERTGHPELLKVRVRRLRADMHRLLTREASTPIDPGCVPARFEHHFGPLAIRSAEADGTGETGEGALHIEGIIDRVDLGPGRAVVLDYKAGRLGRYQDLLNSHLLTTSFQLPLYAAALTVDESLREGGPPLTEVSARYYSLRQGQVSKPLQDAEMISLDPQVRRRAPENNVAEVAYRLWRRLRAGDFRVAPLTCEGCGLEATCRIPAAPAALAEAEAGEGSADSRGSTTPVPSTASPTRDFSTERHRPASGTKERR